MTEDTDPEPDALSRRQLLGGLATMGTAGVLGGGATTSLLWDEEKFGTANDPNVLQGGELDLKVDWRGRYFNGTDEPVFDSGGLVDQPGVLIDLGDVKSGDVLALSLSAHVRGNPAFLGGHVQEHGDTDGLAAAANGDRNIRVATDDDGDLDDHVQAVLWYDDGDFLIEEFLVEVTDGDDHGEVYEHVASLTDASGFSTASATAFAGSLADLEDADFMFDASASNSPGGLVATEHGSRCYGAGATEQIGLLVWVPRDIAGVNDNAIQIDRLAFQFGFDAIQCRHNVANDGGPIDGTIDDADADNNARSP